MIGFLLTAATRCRIKGVELKAEIQVGGSTAAAAEGKRCAPHPAMRAVEAGDPDHCTSGGRRNGEQLIETLQDIQEGYGYLPEGLLREVARELRVPLIEVFRTAHFYKAFSLTPKGEHQITICNGTACHVCGSGRLLQELHSLLGIDAGQTTQDGRFTVETVNCLGACALSPIVVIDGHYYDHVSPAKLRSLIRELGTECSELQRDVG
jgi:NADH-quinone oxidoreductase subunit E